MSRVAILDHVAKEAANKFGVDSREIFGLKRGPRSVVVARRWAYLQLHLGLVEGQEGTPWSGAEIGHVLGRDVSNVNFILKKAIEKNGM